MNILIQNKFLKLFTILAFSTIFTLSAAAQVKEGDNAPSFTLKNLDGKEISLSQFRGKHVLVNFWATWCGPCKIEMPSLEALYEKVSNAFGVVSLPTTFMIDPQGKIIGALFGAEDWVTPSNILYFENLLQ